MRYSDLKAYFLLLITFIALVLSFYLIKPYLVALISGAVFAMICYPFYRYLCRQVGNSNLAGIIVVCLVILLFLIPTVYMVKSFGKESYYVYNVFRQKLSAEQFVLPPCEREGFMCSVTTPIREFFLSTETKFYIKNVTTKINSAIFDYTTNFLIRLPSILMQVGVFLFSLFYFLRDGKYLLKYLSNFMPLDHVHLDHLFKKTNETVSAIVLGNFLTAIVQGFLGGLVFWLFGFSAPLFWGVVIFVLSLVPVLPWLIFAPAGIYIILEGFSSASNTLVFKGIMLLVTGVFVITAMDGLFKPHIIGTKAKMPSLIVILGLVGGVQWFGFVGLFIGPIILTVLLTIFEIFHEIKHKGKKYGI